MNAVDLDRCITLCNVCALACQRCGAGCIQERMEGMERCIALDVDCAAVCTLAVGAMARNSENVDSICALCADICKSCGDECSRHDAEHCQRCAQACRQCEAECRHMASA